MGQGRHDDPSGCRDATVAELARAYAAALLGADEVGAEIAVRDALDAGLSTGEIDDGIIAPALWYVGELWERGEITVADEHIATEISIRMLALQREARRVAYARRTHRVLLATPAGERHVVALQMVGELLRDAGYDVLMLGADVPARALALTARRHAPTVVCMSSTMAGGGDDVLVSMHEIQERLPSVSFVVGGRGVERRVRSLPGIEVCRRVSDAVEAVDAQVQRASMN